MPPPPTAASNYSQALPPHPAYPYQGYHSTSQQPYYARHPSPAQGVRMVKETAFYLSLFLSNAFLICFSRLVLKNGCVSSNRKVKLNSLQLLFCWLFLYTATRLVLSLIIVDLL